MPPRAKRSKPARVIEPENIVASSSSLPPGLYQYAAALRVPKIATLPAELYDEIISQLGALPECIDYKASGGFVELSAHGFQERNEALRALSSACRATRAVFHPRLWERLDCVFVPHDRKTQWYKYAATNAVKKLRGVRDPWLRGYVRIVTLTVPQTSDTPTLIDELALTLPNLPNLHTIQLLACKKPGEISDALAKCKLASVRTVSIDPDAHAIARCCPNATRVLCTSGASTTMINALRTTPKITHFGGYFNWSTMTAKTSAKALVKHAPNLTSLDLRETQNSGGAHYTDILDIFAQLQHLRHLTISIQIRYMHEKDGVVPPLVELEAIERHAVIIDVAQRLMKTRRSVPDDVNCVLVVRFMRWSSADMSMKMREPVAYETVYTYP